MITRYETGKWVRLAGRTSSITRTVSLSELLYFRCGVSSNLQDEWTFTLITWYQGDYVYINIQDRLTSDRTHLEVLVAIVSLQKKGVYVRTGKGLRYCTPSADDCPIGQKPQSPTKWLKDE